MKAIVQEGFGSADVLHLRDIEMPAVADDSVRYVGSGEARAKVVIRVP